MSNIVGSLKVLLGLDAAEYVSGFTKADAVASKFADGEKKRQASIDKTVASLQKQADQIGKTATQIKLMDLAQKGATETQLKAAEAALKQAESTRAVISAGRLVGVATLLAATGIAAMVKSSIDGADHLNDLSKSTGVAVDTLGGIGFAAKQSGSDLDSAAKSIGKLNKSIAEAGSGNKDAADAFRVLGISIRDAAGNTKTADVVLAEVADKFKLYEDGPEKAALALRLFGKSGADLIPLLNEGGRALESQIAYFKRYSGITAQVARDSDDFNDTLEKIKLLSGSTGRNLASELLPSLKATAEAILRIKEQGSALNTFLTFFKDSFDNIAISVASTATLFNVLGTEIGGFFAKAKAAVSGDEEGFLNIAANVKADTDRARSELNRFVASVRGTLSNSAYDSPGRAATIIARQSGNAGERIKAPGLPGAGAEAELKRQLEGQLKAIREAAEARKSVLDFEQRYLQSEYQDGVQSLANFYADEQNIRDQALRVQVASFDKEIAALQAYKSKVTGADRIKAATDITEASAKQALAIQKHAQDNTLAAREEARALEAIKNRYDDIRASVLQLSGDEAGAAKIRIGQQVVDATRTVAQAGGDQSVVAQYKSRLEGTAALKQAQDDYNKVLDRAATAEESIMLAAQLSGASELDVMRQVAAARAQSLQQLDGLVEKANELALALGTGEAIRFAEQLGLAFKRASLEVDPFLVKIREVGKESGASIANQFEDAVVQGKSLRDVLKGIEQDLLRIVTRNLVTKPLGDYLTNFIGGNGAASGGGGLIGSLLGVFGGGRANGGPVAPGMLYQVNERGPEMLETGGRQFLMMGAQGGLVSPSTGSRSVTLNYHAAPNESRRTAMQNGAAIAQQLRTAQARNG